MRKWRIEDSEELYNINGWGVNYFGINEKGNVYVTPRKNGVQVDLKNWLTNWHCGTSAYRFWSVFLIFWTTVLKKPVPVLKKRHRNTISRARISLSTRSR